LGVVDSGEELGEQLLAAGLAMAGGVVVLGLEGGAEFDAGLEVCAGFADGFESAVQPDPAGPSYHTSRTVMITCAACGKSVKCNPAVEDHGA
jgi:hypothetical protein